MSERLVKLDIINGCNIQVRPYQGKRYLIIGALSGTAFVRSHEYEMQDDKNYTIKISGNDLSIFEKDKGDSKSL